MRFVSIRELRSGPSELWKSLKKEEVILTLNGKPIAVLAGVSEDDVEETLKALRQARAVTAMESMHKTTSIKGTDKLTSKEIDAEIRAVRKRRLS